MTSFAENFIFVQNVLTACECCAGFAFSRAFKSLLETYVKEWHLVAESCRHFLGFISSERGDNESFAPQLRFEGQGH